MARRVPLAEAKDDLSRYLRLAADEEIVITRHGRPAGVLIGFGSEDDWFEYRLENHPTFLRRVAEARADLRAGRGVRLEASEQAAPPTPPVPPRKDLREGQTPRKGTKANV